MGGAVRYQDLRVVLLKWQTRRKAGTQSHGAADRWLAGLPGGLSPVWQRGRAQEGE